MEVWGIEGENALHCDVAAVSITAWDIIDGDFIFFLLITVVLCWRSGRSGYGQVIVVVPSNELKRKNEKIYWRYLFSPLPSPRARRYIDIICWA